MKRGFTLVELMISVAILSVGLIFILQGFAHCLNILRISEDNLKATFIIESKIAEAEITVKENWDELENGIKDNFKYNDIDCLWEIEAGSAEIDLEKVPESYEDLRKIEASLSWKEGKRKGRIFLTTYMSPPAKAP